MNRLGAGWVGVKAELGDELADFGAYYEAVFRIATCLVIFRQEAFLPNIKNTLEQSKRNIKSAHTEGD